MEQSAAKEAREWPESPIKRIMVVANQSISLTGLWFFFAAMSLVTLSIAGGLTWLGFWPVLIYAIMELLCVAYCFRLCIRRAQYAELIVVTPEQVVVEQGWPRARHRTEFKRAWARVVTRHPVSRLAPRQVLIRSHGCDCEVGACLTDDERSSLSRRLGELIGDIAATPPLADMANAEHTPTDH